MKFHAILYLVLFGSLTVTAQDTRTISEPKFPSSCIVLKAFLNKTAKGLAVEDENKTDTERLQEAIDTCGEGSAVELAGDGVHSAFLAGPFHLKAGVTLLVDKGVTLYASRTPKDYEMSPGSCGVVSSERSGCSPWIKATNAKGAGIMGEGTLDARGGSKILLNGKEGKTWWDLAADARAGGRQQVPRMIQIEQSDNFTLYKIHLKNSANFHVVYSHGNGFTVWGIVIDTPKDARNTDGIDPSASTNITITQSYIRDGDDNIAIKAGNGPVSHMSVVHNHFYYGHGMSIGSETAAGLNTLLVRDLSLDGTDAGIRIKSDSSDGGLVSGAIYDDVCIRNSRHPIQLQTRYAAGGAKPDKGNLPVFQNIVLHNVRVSGGGTVELQGFDTTHRVGIQFDGVTLDGGEYKFDVEHADVVFGPGPVNFTISGEDSTLKDFRGKGNLPSCKDKFVPFPE